MRGDATETLDEIWSDDLFGRRAEAQLLMDYIESVATRPPVREDSRSFTLAVDVGYGEGKTFFLRRLARHLKTKHPVAFVDCWADDLSDEPLTALAATLDRALDPLKGASSIKATLSEVMAKAGKIAKVVSLGALKRGAALIISDTAVDASGDILTGAPEVIRGAVKSAADVGDDLVGAVFTGVATSKAMRGRIADFEAGKTAIAELKESLTALVSALANQHLTPPIVIVIDELDRCRPTYAIKLLEEIKHLFDVPGLVFVFGMHGEQLSHAISAAYGDRFDGAAYLRRFINRRYKLKQPNLQPLTTQLLRTAGLGGQLVSRIQIVNGQYSPSSPEMDDLLARYMRIYALPIREAFNVVDALQTCVALAEGQVLHVPYLFPMLMSKISGASSGELIPPTINDAAWEYILYDSRRQPARVTCTPWAMAETLHSLLRPPSEDVWTRAQSRNDIFAEIALSMKNGTRGLGDPTRYGELLEAVGRFTNPQLETT